MLLDTGSKDSEATFLEGFLLENDLQELELGGVLTRGQEASLRQIKGKTHLLAKVFHHAPVDLGERLRAMLANPPLLSQTPSPATLAWPTDRLLLVGEYQKCVGYVMPRLPGVRTLPQFCASLREPGCPLHFGQQVRVARQLAATLHALHQKGHVLGAWAPDKILIDSRGQLGLVGTDGWQVCDAGKVWPCRDGVATYLAPELRGSGTGLRHPEQDAYSLAVVIFQLLTLGRLPTSQADGTSPPGLPPAVNQLMSLGLHTDPSRRPKPAAWMQTLAQVEKELVISPEFSAVAAAQAIAKEQPVMVNAPQSFELEICPDTPEAGSKSSSPPPPNVAGEVKISAPTVIISAPPSGLFRPRWICLFLLALIGNGLVLGVRQGWITMPGLQKSLGQTVSIAKKAEKTVTAKTVTAAKVTPPNPNTGQGADEQAKGSTGKSAPDTKDAKTANRSFQTVDEVLEIVHAHLQKTPGDDRRFQRYLTLVHLHNNPKIATADLDLHRATLATVLAQFAAKKNGVIEPLGPEKTVLVLDMRQLGPERSQLWRKIVKAYPYGIMYGDAGNVKLAELARKITELAGCDMPMIRADWFMTAASQGQLQAQLFFPQEPSPSPPELAEPLGKICSLFGGEIGLQEAAYELGLKDVQKVQETIRNKRYLQKLGLKPLLQGEAISRESWASMQGLMSPFQELAMELELGAPLRVAD